MADSNITKKALAAALRELMDEMSFSKITVSNICDKCNMNRKSFYYHFKDKYDLVNWIFYTEFIGIVKGKEYNDGFVFLLDICEYFEQNRRFYRKVLKYDGQNSFFEYFQELLMPAVEKYIEGIFNEDENNAFYTEFFADAFVNAIKKWLLDMNAVSAGQFVSLMKSCIYGTAKKVVDEISSN